MLYVSEINAILTGYKHQNFSNHSFLHLEAAMVALKAQLQRDGGDVQNRNGGHLTATQARLHKWCLI